MRKEDKLSGQSINRLNISSKIIKKLENNNIITLYELCSKTKTDLKKSNLTQDEINDIQIKLQLEGLNLRGGL